MFKSLLHCCSLTPVFYYIVVAQVVESACNAGDPGWEDLEEGMATHSSTLAWRIPWTEEPGGLQTVESKRVGHS